LHIDTGREMRGGQRQVLLLLKLLNGAGHRCVLLAAKESALHKAVAGSGIPVHDARLWHVWSLSGQADLIHVHDAHAHTLAAFAGRAPLIVSRRVAFPVSRSLPSRWKYARAARFIAVSRFVAGQLAAAGISSGKVDVIYDAVDEIPRQACWSPDAPVIALATADPMKGRDLVEAACRLANVRPVFSKDLSRDLQRASMLLYISRSEGLGSAALLAMAMGVPVIASRVGGLAEIIDPGVSGIYVENDPAQIAAAIEQVRSNSDFARVLIESAHRRIAAQFSKEHLLDATVESYSRALAG
jgi:glycosyltransferase involved in cell wall biosynthesis